MRRVHRARSSGEQLQMHEAATQKEVCVRPRVAAVHAMAGAIAAAAILTDVNEHTITAAAGPVSIFHAVPQVVSNCKPLGVAARGALRRNIIARPNCGDHVLNALRKDRLVTTKFAPPAAACALGQHKEVAIARRSDDTGMRSLPRVFSGDHLWQAGRKSGCCCIRANWDERLRGQSTPSRSARPGGKKFSATLPSSTRMNSGEPIWT